MGLHLTEMCMHKNKTEAHQMDAVEVLDAKEGNFVMCNRRGM